MARQYSKSIVVHDDIDHVFQLWSSFDNFPHFMKHIKSITKTDDRTSHWVMEGPLGKEVQWDARIIDYDPNHRIAWQSTGGDIETQGHVLFEKIADDETRVTLSMEHTAPGGKVGEVIARILKDPEKQLEDDLKHFKEFAESMHVRSMGGQ